MRVFTYEAQILNDFEDSEVVQSPGLSNLAQEFVQCTFFTVLRLDIEMKIMLPVVDIMNNMFSVRQSFQDSDLPKLVLPILWPVVWLLAFLDSIDLRLGEKLGIIKILVWGGSQSTKIILNLGLCSFVDKGKLAFTNLLNVIKLGVQACINVESAVTGIHRCDKDTGG